MSFKEITPAEFSCCSFTAFDKDWALLTAQKGQEVNTMTISWGGLGTLWGEPVAFVFVRPSRHTYGFMEAAETFSLTFFAEEYRAALTHCGTVSGRDENKIAAVGLDVLMDGTTPYFEQAHTALICGKLYAQKLDLGCAIGGTMAAHYPDGDTHKLYIAKVEKILIKD